MRVILQRSKKSSVTVDGIEIGKIDSGLVLLTGFTSEDDKAIVDKMIDKIINLRIFEDKEGKMNLSLLDVSGSILNISQFTLYANSKNGRRPSFTDALRGDEAIKLYDYMNKRISEKGIPLSTGEFGSDMKVNIYNDGPVTIILDSNEIYN